MTVPQKSRRTPAAKTAPAGKASATKSSVTVTWDGRKYTLNRGEVTAREALDVRRATGGTPLGALLGDLDIDGLAVIIWLVRRRVEKTLTLDAVLDEIAYDADRFAITFDGPDSDSPEV